MAEKKTNQYKRRQYFINRKFQIVFILKFFMVLVLGGILSVVITLITTQATLTTSFSGSRLIIEKTSFAILPSVIFTNVITTGVIGLLAILVTLLASHKIAGPMFRFEHDLKNIAAGDLSNKIHIRNGDQFSSVAVNLNDMVGNINSKIREVQHELEQMSESAIAQKIPQTFVNELETCRKNIDLKFKL